MPTPPSNKKARNGEVPPPPRPARDRRTRSGGGSFMVYPYQSNDERARIMAHVETALGAGGSLVAGDDGNTRAESAETKRCIANLLAYRAVRTRARLPRGPSAAVLVPLFVGRSGEVYVVLSRRSDELKTFAGDTALPGGRVDAQDGTVEDTARREAFEEVGLPQDKERVPLLCVMEPHLARGDILVTPVVVLILDHSLQPNLNSSEVASIFAQPLASFLSSTPRPWGGRTLADPKNPYHTTTDISLGGGVVRVHQFLTGREAEGVKPVYGLTASILIKTATVGYGRQPDFEVRPPGALTPPQQIARALLTPASPLRVACEREGISAGEAAAQLLRPPLEANTPRTIEWEEIGAEWKSLLEGDEHPGRQSLQTHVDEVMKDAQGRVGSEDGERMEGLHEKVDAFKKRAQERKEQGEEHGEERWEDAIPDMATLGAFLDKTRDEVHERMKELKGDRRKLAEARRAYSKIAEQVSTTESLRDEDGKLGPKAPSTMIPKEDEGAEGEKSGADSGDGKGWEQGIKWGKEGTRRGLEEMKKYVGKGRDGSPEQMIPRKRDAKL